MDEDSDTEYEVGASLRLRVEQCEVSLLVEGLTNYHKLPVCYGDDELAQFGNL